MPAWMNVYGRRIKTGMGASKTANLSRVQHAALEGMRWEDDFLQLDCQRIEVRERSERALVSLYMPNNVVQSFEGLPVMSPR